MGWVGLGWDGLVGIFVWLVWFGVFLVGCIFGTTTKGLGQAVLFRSLPRSLAGSVQTCCVGSFTPPLVSQGSQYLFGITVICPLFHLPPVPSRVVAEQY